MCGWLVGQSKLNHRCFIGVCVFCFIFLCLSFLFFCSDRAMKGSAWINDVTFVPEMFLKVTNYYKLLQNDKYVFFFFMV